MILDHLDHAENIAVDWIGRKIYFIDSGTKSIDVCNLDGTVRKRLIWEKVDAPRSLAINLRARFVGSSPQACGGCCSGQVVHILTHMWSVLQWVNILHILTHMWSVLQWV